MTKKKTKKHIQCTHILIFMYQRVKQKLFTSSLLFDAE